MRTLLESVGTPADLRRLSLDELEMLAEEVRSRIIQTVSVNGGHFGGVANLELWTEWQWWTSRDKAEPFPF